ncbi:MAG: A/G-specific adenine glycosylase [Planctomycetes bacterium]|nr:A/G-specific adenine glycosylase [Planctomycetota bacterium]
MKSPPFPDARFGARVRGRLLAHWRRGHRDLPWRRTRDPYAILVSEVMLQQTRVETVVPYYERFLRLFPTARALARAPLPRALAAWSGLGYYRRARMLREAARRIVADHGGRFPDDPESIRSLPGVGPYTAGALLSIAFGKPFAVLDGNVARVLSRLLALRGDPRRNRRILEAAAAALVDPRSPGAFNQALMELGALVCTPRRPDCPRCPLRSLCRARALGIEAKIPPTRRERTRRVEWASAVLRRRDRVLLVRRPDGGLLAGMWELPTVEVGGSAARTFLARRLLRLLGAPARLGSEIGRIRHAIEDRAITIRLFDARAGRGGSRTPAARWCALRESVDLPLAAAARKSLALASSSRGPWTGARSRR